MAAKRAEKKEEFDDFLFASETEKPRRRRVAAAPAGTKVAGPSGPAMVGGPSGPAMVGGPSGPAMVGGPSGPAMKGTAKAAAPAKRRKRIDKETLDQLYS